MTRAYLGDVLSVGRDASLLAGGTLTGRVSFYVPLRVAIAFTTHTLTMIWTRTKHSLVTVAGEIVALTKLARNILIPVFPRIAFASPADAVASVVAESLAGVVRPASVLQISVQLEIGGVAFAVIAEGVVRTFADSAFIIRSLIIALR